MPDGTPAARRQRVLYVDDDQMMLDAFKQYVELLYDIDVTTALSPAKAMAVLEREPFDVVVSDFQMPEKNGIDFLKELRADGIMVPFILFTGKGREEVVIEALNNGADFYVQKGGEPNSLFREMAHYITLCSERRRKEEELLATKERLESFVQNTAESIILFDLEGRIISVNSAFEQTFGWPKEEAVGLVLPMVPDNEMGAIKKLFRQVAETGKAMRYKGRRLRKSGEFFDAVMTVSPVKDLNGKTIAIAGLALDRSSEVMTLETIERQKEELNVLLSSIGDAVIATDREGRVTFMNQVAAGFTGNDQNDVIGKDVDSVFHIINEDTRQPAEIPVGTVIKQGIVVGMANHTILISKDGTERMIEDSAAPIKGVDGFIRGVVMVFRDATVEKLTLRRREARRKVSEILATADSVEKVLPAVLEAVCASLKLQAGEIWFPDESGKSLKLKATWSVESAQLQEFEKESRGVSFGIGSGLPGGVLAAMKPLWIQLIGNEPQFGRSEIARQAGLRSVFGVPLSSHGNALGAMLFFSASEMKPDTDLMNTMEDIGKQVGLLVSKLEAESRLKVISQNLQSFVKHTPLIVISTDLEGRILSVNDSFEKAYGWTAEEVTGRTIDVLIPKGEKRDLNERMRTVAEGNSVRYEARRVRKDGQMIDIAVMLSPVTDKNGNVVQITSISREITEEKKARSIANINHAIIENLNEMVLVTELDGKGEPVVVYANPAFLKASESTLEEISGKYLFELDRSLVDTDAVNDIYNAFKAGLPSRREIVHTDAKGEKRFMETHFFPLRDEEGRVTNWVLLQRDVTSFVDQREKLRVSNEKLNLMETISRHDMMNHLQAIELYIHTMLNASEDSDVASRLEKINKITEQMKRQLNALKELKSSGNPRWMNVHKTFLDSITGMDTRGIRIRVEGENADIVADPLVERVFYNFVDNSIRHGGSVRNITLLVIREGEGLRIVYTDDGSGIQASEKDTIFTTSRDGRSHGLRLARDVLRITGIQIQETGEAGKGARFELSVPDGGFRIRGTN